MIVNIISPHASHYLGGMEVVTIQMAKFLARSEVSVRFFTRHTNEPSDIYAKLVKASYPSLRLVEIPLPSSTPLANSTWQNFYRISCDFGIDAQPFYEQYMDADLFVTHLSIDSIFVPKTSKTVLHLHGSPSIKDPLMEASIQIPHATIAHSRSIRQWWTEQFPYLNPVIFTNGVDTEYYVGDPMADRPIDILYVGRFMEHKGITDVLKAISPECSVVIAGNGPYLNELKRLAIALNLTNNVTFYDKPSTEKIKLLYSKSKIFACPSWGREGVLTTMLEAGAAGCAIVTTSGSGMTDLAKNYVNGIVVPPKDINALGEAFTFLIEHPRARILLANKMQSEIRKSWSWDTKIGQLKEIYNAAL